MTIFSVEWTNALICGRTHDIDFDILLIDDNNVAKKWGFLDKPNDEEFIFNTCWDHNACLEVSTFYNYFVMAVFFYHMISHKNVQDILAGRFKIGCYVYDVVVNAYKWLFDSKSVLMNALLNYIPRNFL